MNTTTKHTTQYKNSPLGLIPEDWEVKHFEDVSDIDKNSLKGNTSEDYEFDYVSLSDVSSDEFKIETTKQIFKSAPSRARRIVKQGDILMSTVRPNLQGFTLIRDDVKDLIASTGFAVITSKQSNNEFLFHFLFSDLINKQFHELLVGSNYPAINSSDVRKLKLPIPPLSEQKAIADCLSTWDKAIEKQSALIVQKELAKKALMQQLLSGKKRLKGFSGEWKVVRLGIECELVTKGTTPSSLGREFTSKGVNFIKIESLEENGAVIQNKVAFIDEQTHELLKRSQLRENDLLISIAGALGRVALVNKQILPANTNQALAIIRLKKESKLKIKYLYYFLNSPKVKKEIDAINVQAAQANLSLSNINDLTVLYPSLEEQTAIANVLQCADDELQLLKKKLDQLKEQKKGLMQVLLTGKKRLNY